MSPIDQFPSLIGPGVRARTMKGMPPSSTWPNEPCSMSRAIANVQDPLVGRAVICVRMQGQTKSQLQVAKYRPLIDQEGVVIALPPDSSPQDSGCPVSR